MFNSSTVLACFNGSNSSYIGWRNSDDPCEKALATKLTTSDSGSYFNEYHPLLTYKNIKSIAINDKGFKIGVWDVATNYITGKYVEYEVDGKTIYYKSLDDVNLGNQPDISPLFWEEVDFLSDWYERRTNESLDKLVHNVAINKQLRHKTKTILDDFKIYKNSGRIKDTITKSGRFVGFYIKLKQAENIKLLINQIGLQFTQLQVDLPIYLYHTSQNDPLSIINYSTTKSNSFEWLSSSYTLKYVDDNYDTGAFFLGYYEDDVTGQAINKDMNWDNPCFGCNGWKNEDYRSFSQFMGMQPITIASTDIEPGRVLFDLDNVRYTNNTNFGLNLNISIKCDWSDFICRNKDLFRNAYKAQVGYDFLNEMLYSTRDNDLKEKVAAAIQGNEAIAGMQQRLNDEIDSLNFDMSDLGGPCMPCENKKGVRQSAA